VLLLFQGQMFCSTQEATGQQVEVSTWQGTCVVDQDVEGAPLAQVVCGKGPDAVGV
jgi:hypothetical protein